MTTRAKLRKLFRDWWNDYLTIQQHEVNAKDKAGILRCYGIGRTEHEALRQCKIACLEYIKSRPDITELYLYYGDSDKPMIDCKSKQVMKA